MTKLEVDSAGNADGIRKYARLLALTGLFFGFVLALGYITGVIAAIIHNGGFSMKSGRNLGGALIAAALCGYGVWQLKPDLRFDEPMSAKTKTANWMLLAAVGLGAIIGVVLAVPGLEQGVNSTLSNSPLPVVNALFVVTAYALLLPLLSLYWHKNADEFERGASGQGALAAIYTYAFIAPIWWILERADIAPAQEPMIVYLIVMGVWGLVWQVRRSN